MPSASIKKKIQCSKESLIKIVLDIEKYPKFVPWCLDGKIHNRVDKGNKIEITADLTIGKRFFNETYKSFVVYNKLTDSIDVTNVNGPLKYLKNKWFFKQMDSNSEVDFYIDFELRNKILNLLMTRSFDVGIKKIADSFEKRAIELHESVEN